MTQKITELLDRHDFTKLKEILNEINPADIAVLLEDCAKEQALLLFRLLSKENAAETFVLFEGDTQEEFIRSFSDTELHEVMDELYLDDTVDLIEEMPANVVTRLLKHTDADTRKLINEMLRYPRDSAGSIMTIEFVDLKKTMTVADAFKRIRRTGVDKETIYTCYVTDDFRHLEGVVTVKELLLSDYNQTIAHIMETNLISVHTLEDQEVVAHAFNKYDFLALPVVDAENRLVGIVTVDDALDVLQDENTEDIEKMAAITPSDRPYLKTSVFYTWRSRIPWLLLLMVSATFTGKIIQNYESALASVTALTAFIPMLMDTCGNAGSQASVTIIRGLSLNEISFKDTFRIMLKEFMVSILCGITLAAANFIKLMLIDRVSVWIALVVCLTLVCSVIFAKLVGCTLPILAKRLKFDPAVMASPFITTIVDALSLLIYFQVATAVLGL